MWVALSVSRKIRLLTMAEHVCSKLNVLTTASCDLSRSLSLQIGTIQRFRQNCIRGVLMDIVDSLKTLAKNSLPTFHKPLLK